MEKEHEELFHQYEDRIRKCYKLPDQELELIGMEAQVGEHEGVYYRMTFRRPDRSQYKMRI